ncbi:MAG: TonB-dependent receptor [Cytophagales bacterium]
MKYFLLFILFISNNILIAQTKSIKGTIYDSNDEELVGINIYVTSDKSIGTVSDISGNFELTTILNYPFKIELSGIGYENTIISIRSDKDLIQNITLDEAVLYGEEVVVSASLFEQNILTAPVSIEKLDILDIEQSSAANFYDELYKIKGVDMIVQSLSMRFPNTRGFNGNTNYRINQLVDGVNNSAPGLSFSPGNIFGLVQLDVESVELVVGASSALYGPGGMNGTLLMTSKNPFDYEGLSVSLQGGVMHFDNDYGKDPSFMNDFSFRYGKKISDRVAFKITGGYLKADDWNASDYRNKIDLTNPNSNRWTDSGYDGVNIYGDEVTLNLEDIEDQIAEGFADNLGHTEGTQEYNDAIDLIKNNVPDKDLTRTGFKEVDLVDYNAENVKIGASFHYNINNNLKSILQFNYAKGSSVYSAQNRFSLNNFSIMNYKAELQSETLLVRFSGANENSGDTYDAGTLAIQMNETWKSSELWYQDFFTGFLNGKLAFALDDDESVKLGRMYADNVDEFGNILDSSKPHMPQSGTSQLNNLKESIISKNIPDGGARVFDKSSMYNFDFNYNFKNLISSFNLLLGGSLKYTVINSEGSIFYDKPGDPLEVYEIGAFLQYTDEWFSKRVFPNISLRLDKNQYFSTRVTPRFSMVYSMDSQSSKFLRLSAQTAFRFPSVVDQWTDLYVAPINVVGGQSVLQDQYKLRGSNIYPLDGNNPVLSNPILTDAFNMPDFGPEKVTAFEIGYKSLYLDKRILLDAYVFYNNYNGFLAQQLLSQDPLGEDKRFITTVSLDQPVNSYGWAIGIDYKLKNNFELSSNVSYNDVNTVLKPGFQIQFNTADYRYNISLGNRKLSKLIGFNINYRWQNSFLWESAFGVGTIPQIHNLDAQVTFNLNSINTKLKVGGSNILNNYHTTSFGSASVGALYYISILLDNII